jgi:hypothetical protein
MLGVSYPGWLTAMAMLDPHPALRAASPQASPADMFLGDDFHHNGAFRLSYGFEYVAMPPEARDVPGLMKDLARWINHTLAAKELPVPVVAALAHYQFATIHSYLDGNGRTARLLTNLILHRSGYGLGGIYSLEEHYAANLDDYYAGLAVGKSHNYLFRPRRSRRHALRDVFLRRHGRRLRQGPRPSRGSEPSRFPRSELFAPRTDAPAAERSGPLPTQPCCDVEGHRGLLQAETPASLVALRTLAQGRVSCCREPVDESPQLPARGVLRISGAAPGRPTARLGVRGLSVRTVEEVRHEQSRR